MDIGDKTLQQPKIRVVIRKRPLSKKEVGRGEHDAVEVVGQQAVVVREQK